jgi:ATP-dependent DNA helicase RecQ
VSDWFAGLISREVAPADVGRFQLFDRPVALDPSIELDPTFELPFWNELEARHPEFLAWCTPQASLDALSPSAVVADRWVDFLLWAPWMEKPLVIEIDGSGHQRRLGVDRDRDTALSTAGAEVLRVPGGELSRPDAHIWRRLGQVAAEMPPVAASDAGASAIIGPAWVSRFACAVVEAVTRGLLEKGRPWVIDLVCGLDLGPGVAQTLDLLSAVDSLWETGVVPNLVVVGSTRFERSGADGAFTSVGEGDGAPASVTIVLNDGLPPHAALPDAIGPTIFVRQAFLPVALTWRQPASLERRTVASPEQAEIPLRRLLRILFGFDAFREGQLESISQVLAGGDCVVLLPTGAGKSLIYQFAGLLRPGMSVIVDPLKALIDDQERRLTEEGIPRVAGLHSGRGVSEEILQQIARGDMLFVFLTPERMQSKAFRASLRQVAAESLVNLAVIDETHCVSEWGHDFRTAYLRLGRNLRNYASGDDDVPPPILALTGTASPAVLRDVLRELTLDAAQPGVLQRPRDFDRANLRFSVVRTTPQDRKADLARIIRSEVPSELGVDATALAERAGGNSLSGLVFVPHANGDRGILSMAHEVRDALATGESSDAVQVYSGDRPRDWAGQAWDDYKVSTADAFQANDVTVLVTTKAFGMGIDKPNIRWTVHAGLPSSLEAFAQEAGRAGRNGELAMCELLAVLPPDASASSLLDLRRPWRDVVEAHEQSRSRDDINAQLYFMKGSFPGEETEVRRALALLDELKEGMTPGGIDFAIPREPSGGWLDLRRDVAGAREKALYRLALAGLVFDYTVDYGANAFEVEFAAYSDHVVDRATMDFLVAVEPGRKSHHQRLVAEGPAELADRVAYHVELIVSALYRVIQPARLQALREIYDLARRADSDQTVRATLNAYLSEGPVASVLLSLVTAPRLDLASALVELEAVRPAVPEEWAGSAARLLESYGDHPLLLSLRSLAESWRADGSRTAFRSGQALAYSRFRGYGVSDAELDPWCEWLREWTTGGFGGPHADWASDLWQAWEPDAGELDRLEAMVLEDGSASPEEKVAVLERRMRRHAVQVSDVASAWVGAGR